MTSKKNFSSWPKDFVLDDKKKKYATQNGIDYRKLDEFWGEFRDWCEANGAKYKDWDAAFRMRVRKAKQWGQFQGPSKPKQVAKCDHKNLELRAYDALIQTKGKNAAAIKERLGLSNYEMECVLMKYSGGQSKVSDISNGMFEGIKELSREEKIAELRSQGEMLKEV